MKKNGSLESLDFSCGDESSNSYEMKLEEIYEWNVKQNILESIREHIRPLDMILFSGNNLVSKTIRLVEREKRGLGTISHIGIVVTKDILPHIKELEEDKLYIWESTSSKNKIISKPTVEILQNKDIYGQSKFGVQIRELDHVVDLYLKYQGRVFWGKLKLNPLKCKNVSYRTQFQIKKNVQSIMYEIEKKYGNSSFNLNIIDLAASIFPSLRPLRTLKKKISKIFKKKKQTHVPLFCSEFVAIIYKSLSIMDIDTDPSNIVPVDFLKANENGVPKIIKKIVEIVLPS